MAKRTSFPKGGLTRSKYGQKVRDVQAQKLSSLRGKEKMALKEKTAFDKPVEFASKRKKGY